MRVKRVLTLAIVLVLMIALPTNQFAPESAVNTGTEFNATGNTESILPTRY